MGWGKSIFSPQNAIFHTRYEKINLAIAPPVFLACLAACFLNYNVTSTGNMVLHFFVFFIFMNVVHTAFTFVMLMKMPEFRNYLSAQTTVAMKRRGVIAVSCLLLLIAMISYSSHFEIHWWFAAYTAWIPIVLFKVPLDFWSTIHVLRQTMGLSLLYNHNLQRDPSVSAGEKTQARVWERHEKFIFKMMAVTLAVRMIVAVVWPQFWPLCRNSFVVLDLAGCAYVVWRAFCLPGEHKKNKTVFLTRILYYALSPFHFLFVYAIQSIHGLEYYFLMKKMLGNSSVSKSHAKEIVIYGMLLGTCILIPQFVMFYAKDLPQQLFGSNIPLWAIFLLSGARVLNLMHFYMDGFIYRFRDPAVRNNIGPLILTPPVPIAPSAEVAQAS